MFCPKCGTGEQLPETYCRNCGTFLPDLTKPAKKEQPASEHIKANVFFSALTIVTSFTLAALLYIFMAFRPDTHALIYITAGFLLAIGGWHIQTFIRTLMLRKQLKKWGRLSERKDEPTLAGTPPVALNEATRLEFIPASVTERTTRQLAERKRPLP